MNNVILIAEGGLLSGATSAVSSITGVVSNVISFVTSEPFFMIPLGAALLGMGIAFYKKFRR